MPYAEWAEVSDISVWRIYKSGHMKNQGTHTPMDQTPSRREGVTCSYYQAWARISCFCAANLETSIPEGLIRK